MGRCAIVILLATSGCHFTRTVESAADGGPDRPDSPDSTAAAFDVAHLSPEDQLRLTSTVDWQVSAPTTLDTGTGLATPALPGDVFAMVLAQVGDGAELFVVQAGRIEIGATLRVVGSRPLVLVGVDAIEISAMIDASAVGAAPGPGGADPGLGLGGGPAGASDDASHDAGGAGASFGTSGMPGGIGGPGSGSITTQPKPPQAIYGDAMLTLLQGGSGGGNPSPLCLIDQRFGGGGGGAVQLSAPTISLDGTIHVGGGGAEAVNACVGNGLGGGGGGSGGAIYVQATALLGAGMLAANGGGGSGTAKGDGTPGPAGEDGRADATPAAGGVGQYGNGGAGAALVDATVGTQGDNGGGGGGGAGRIVIDVPGSITVVSSPLATRR